ncbi:amidohydrolase [Desulfosarcina ovata subsp. sediminis]|uniref:Amidohydrolase n=1 Tax=Desulfosarcina ovata subsp. sediminis TaxID=885957 RepID=A0A5K7ZZI6_9BACT|nr:amidohydrolase family protein [Desulfosarcina ovata]BBO85677.1 amidohydrolase [Desulfosarcina ovata subsp. sediminis]
MKCIFADQLYTGTDLRSQVFLSFKGTDIIGAAKTKPAACQLIGEFPVVTPAFIDPHSHIGLYRAGEPESEGEGNEQARALFFLPDALDSLQMDDPAFADAIEMGVLYSCIVPGSGNIVGGLSAIIRHFANNSSEALVGRAGVKAAFGYNPMSTRNWKGERPTTRMGAVGMFREKLYQVRDKLDRRQAAKGKEKDKIEFSAEERVLRDLMAGKTILRCHVHKTDDIAALLRLVDAFGLRVTVEHAGDVHQPEIFTELRRRNIPVAFGPLDSFAYKVELRHENWRNIRHLIDSEVFFGLITDHPVIPARNLLLTTRWLIRCGYTRQQAIEVISRKNAEFLGIEKKVGTLRKGRWASFTCWNGDPFDLTAYPVAVFGEGRCLYQPQAANC